jgi:flagellar hook-associated protein 3 FlgL
MRITTSMLSNNTIQDINDSLAKLNDYQKKVSSGKNFVDSSENPSGVSLSLRLRSTLSVSNDFLNTANFVDDWMTANDSAIKQGIDIGTRANTLAKSGLSDTFSATERSAYATEINELIKQALDSANASHEGKYIFSGYQINTKPFTMSDPNTIDPYHGDTGTVEQTIGAGIKVTMNIDGENTFKPLLQALVRARNALQSTPYDSNELNAAVTDINTSIQTMKEAQTNNAARQSQVENNISAIKNTQAEIKSLLSKNEDVNMAEMATLITNQQTTYQAVLEVSQRAISALNLFDYLK